MYKEIFIKFKGLIIFSYKNLCYTQRRALIFYEQIKGEQYMRIKKCLVVGMSASALLLTACSEETLEDAKGSVNELEHLHSEVVSELNDLHDSEAAL